ncbi:basic proline-rich protein-like [Zalophus californianus]|uniref:Basic proline-rich protein-like n=1 Tax=Zalophus californianus TaxID=9704 RepID=A0A6P9FEU7_ZALCA|nr:basic proline-rich protein-like [Zalophus californianus]
MDPPPSEQRLQLGFQPLVACPSSRSPGACRGGELRPPRADHLPVFTGGCPGLQPEPRAPPPGACASWAASWLSPASGPPDPLHRPSSPAPLLPNAEEAARWKTQRGRNPITALHPQQPPDPRPDPVTASLIPGARSPARPPNSGSLELESHTVPLGHSSAAACSPGPNTSPRAPEEPGMPNWHEGLSSTDWHCQGVHGHPVPSGRKPSCQALTRPLEGNQGKDSQFRISRLLALDAAPRLGSCPACCVLPWRLARVPSWMPEQHCCWWRELARAPRQRVSGNYSTQRKPPRPRPAFLPPRPQGEARAFLLAQALLARPQGPDSPAPRPSRVPPGGPPGHSTGPASEPGAISRPRPSSSLPLGRGPVPSRCPTRGGACRVPRGQGAAPAAPHRGGGDGGAMWGKGPRCRVRKQLTEGAQKGCGWQGRHVAGPARIPGDRADPDSGGPSLPGPRPANGGVGGAERSHARPSPDPPPERREPFLGSRAEIVAAAHLGAGGGRGRGCPGRGFPGGGRGSGGAEIAKYGRTAPRVPPPAAAHLRPHLVVPTSPPPPPVTHRGRGKVATPSGTPDKGVLGELELEERQVPPSQRPEWNRGAVIVPTGASGREYGWVLRRPGPGFSHRWGTHLTNSSPTPEKPGESGTQLVLGARVATDKAMVSGALQSPGELGSCFTFWAHGPHPQTATSSPCRALGEAGPAPHGQTPARVKLSAPETLCESLASLGPAPPPPLSARCSSPRLL